MLDKKRINLSSNGCRALGLGIFWQIYVNTTNAVILVVIWLNGLRMQRLRKWIARTLMLGLTIYISIFSARLMFSWVDYAQIDSFHDPIFSKPGSTYGFAHFADGGTTSYVGFGYDITMMH